ncbi:MAG TPA: helix-turn-helix transcriptional regulator [Polyangiaceae bacterium]|nr:helix-turn-helix transcriptional regulator [Polyangiaceae bacterium]
MATRKRQQPPSTGKKSLSPEQAERVREILQKVVEERFSTKTEAAKALGVSQPFLSQVLKGVHGAGMTVLHGLSRLTGRSIDELMHGTTEGPPALSGPEPSLTKEQADNVRALTQRYVDAAFGNVTKVAEALFVSPDSLAEFLKGDVIPGFRFVAMLSDRTGYPPGEILAGTPKGIVNTARPFWNTWAPEGVSEEEGSVPARDLPGWASAVEVVRKHDPDVQAWALDAAGRIRVDPLKTKNVTPAFVLDLARFAFQFMMGPYERMTREEAGKAEQAPAHRPDLGWLYQARIPESRLVERGDGTAQEVRRAIEDALADGDLVLVEGLDTTTKGPLVWAEKGEDGSVKAYKLNDVGEIIVAANMVRLRLRSERAATRG